MKKNRISVLLAELAKIYNDKANDTPEKRLRKVLEKATTYDERELISHVATRTEVSIIENKIKTDRYNERLKDQ